MDWPAIGNWAGESAPLLAIIAAQSGLIWKFANRLFEQQDMVMRAVLAADKATTVAEKATEVAKQVVSDS